MVRDTIPLTIFVTIFEPAIQYNMSRSTMRKPSKTDTGPFKVSDITDYVRGNLVAQQRVPITIEQKGRYAILAPPGKDLRIICVGCFEPGMSLNDDRKCKKISSYCQHVEGVKKGKITCNATEEDTLEACMARCAGVGAVEEIEEVVAVKDLGEVATEDLVLELKRRNEDLKFILPSLDVDDIVQFTREMGVKPLLDARPADLEAELRRVTDPMKPGIDSFYAATPVDGKPHCALEPMMSIDAMLEWHNDRVGGTSESTKLIPKGRVAKPMISKAIREARKLDGWVNPVAKSVLEGASRTSARKRKAKAPV
jgi:Holliday junction resolvase